MSQGRHSYIAFYPSDWLGGTARMTRLHKSVYFDVCLYIWDKAEPCPATELPLMLGDLESWPHIVEDLVNAGKLVRNPDGSLVNEKALDEGKKAFELWRKKSEGGKGGADKTNARKVKTGTPARTADASPVKSADRTPVESGPGLPTQNQNQNQNHHSEDKSSDAGASLPAAPAPESKPAEQSKPTTDLLGKPENPPADDMPAIPPFLVKLAENADISKVLFKQGLAWIAEVTGKPADKCRPLIGKWRQACHNDDVQIWDALCAASRQNVADLPSYMGGCLRPKGQRKADEGEDDGLSPAVRHILAERAAEKGAA